MAFIFRFRRGTAAQWTASTRPLAAGEPGLLLDAEANIIGLKFGNGVDLWDELDFYGVGGGGDLAAHIATYGAGAHLPPGGTPGQIPYTGGSGTAVTWADPPAGGGGDGNGTSIAVMDYDEATSAYVAVGGANPALADLRWWRGPDVPKNVAGGSTWQPGDFYIPTGIAS